MKKVLLGSTAFLSAALLSHGAMAQTAPAATPDQPVKLGISGFFQGGYMANLHESGTGKSRLPDAVQQYGLIDFSGDTKFSNGLGAGVFIDFYAWNHTDGTNVSGTNGTVRQSWVHITGDSFGEVRIGDSTDVRRAQAVIAPEFAPDALFSANSPDLGISNGAIVSNTTTAILGTKIPTSVTYYTPTISGFKFGVSYAPDSTKGNTGPSNTASYAGLPGVPSFRDEYSATGTWSGNLGPAAISASVGITGATTKQNTIVIGNQANPMVYNAGVMATIGPWAVGGDYEQANNLVGVGGMSFKTFDVGMTYTVGALTTGAEFSRGVYKGIDGEGTGAPKLNTAIIGASYLLGPGVTVTGGLQANDYDTGNTQYTAGAAPGYDNIALLMGTDIKF